MKGGRRKGQAEGTGHRGRSLVAETDGRWTRGGGGRRAEERGHWQGQLDSGHRHPAGAGGFP